MNRIGLYGHPGGFLILCSVPTTCWLKTCGTKNGDVAQLVRAYGSYP